MLKIRLLDENLDKMTQFRAIEREEFGPSSN
jgi:hypothetical protein